MSTLNINNRNEYGDDFEDDTIIGIKSNNINKACYEISMNVDYSSNYYYGNTALRVSHIYIYHYIHLLLRFDFFIL